MLRRVGSAVCLAALLPLSTGSARPDAARVIPEVPRFKLFASSHSTAAAEVLAFHGVKTGLPRVVLIGGLEGRIYRCDCGKDVHLWDIAEGTRLWAAAEGLKVKTEAKVLRGGPSLGSGSPGGGASPDDLLDFAQYRQAIDANQPVVLTYSLDPASAQGMEASFRSEDRVSVVGVGYEQRDSGTFVVALLPEDAGKEKRFDRLLALPGVKAGSKEGLVLIPWDLQTGNLIATFITLRKP